MDIPANFITTTSSKLNMVPIKDGQFIVISDVDKICYDMNNKRHIISDIKDVVTAFNGRTGVVTPQAGDYTAEQVGAIPLLQKASANGVASLDSSSKIPSSQIPTLNYDTKGTASSLITDHDTNIQSHKDIRYNISNRNLLDNWYFVGEGTNDDLGFKQNLQYPINQLNKIEYTTPGYTIDRWYSNCTSTAPIRLTSKGISMTGRVSFYQRIESLNIDPSQTYTLSILDSEGVLYTMTNKFPSTIASSNEVKDNGLTMRLFTAIDHYQVQFFYQADADTHTFVAAKLEPSTTQSLAYQLGSKWILKDAPPNIQQELIKCQRYLQRIIGEPLCFGLKSNSLGPLQFRVSIPLTTNMRILPTVGDCQYTSVRTVEGEFLRPNVDSIIVHEMNATSLIICFNVSGNTGSAKVETPLVGYLVGQPMIDANI